MSSMGRGHLLAAALSAFLMTVGSAQADPERAIARDSEEGAEGTLQVRVIAHRLMVRCDLSSRAGKRIPVHLLVEPDDPGSFELVGPAQMAPELEPGDTVTAHFPGFALKDLPPAAVGDERFEMYKKRVSGRLPGGQVT
jgi:hypothetical protein